MAGLARTGVRGNAWVNCRPGGECSSACRVFEDAMRENPEFCYNRGLHIGCLFKRHGVRTVHPL